jgi:hypothetical protein
MVFRFRLVPDSQRRRLPLVFFRQRRMEAAAVPARRDLTNAVLMFLYYARVRSASSHRAASAGLLQRTAATRVYLGNHFRHCDGVVGARDL